MDYLPIFLKVREQRCLVVGGGDVAARKAAMLLRAGARVHVVAPEIDEGLRDKLAEAGSSFRLGVYDTSDLQD
ncbi:MAG TPA: NAD(P)-dependent oxidoreductase, partial [Moraxellaceae bacterium]